MIVTVGSVRGSPGVTSWALLLAAAWPAGVDRVVLEADPDGGVLGARYGVGVEPGAVSLVAALRRASVPVPVEEHGRRIGDVWVVPGPETAEQSRRVWSAGAESSVAPLAADERVWIVDAGRLSTANPSRAFAASSAMVVLVSGPRLEDVVQLPSRVASLPAPSDRVGVLVVGKSDYSRAELSEFVGVGHVWMVDDHPDLVPLAGQLLGPGRARRSWLWRQAVDVASAIADATTVESPVVEEMRR